jgi:hypothetical protein
MTAVHRPREHRRPSSHSHQTPRTTTAVRPAVGQLDLAPTGRSLRDPAAVGDLRGVQRGSEPGIQIMWPHPFTLDNFKAVMTPETTYVPPLTSGECRGQPDRVFAPATIRPAAGPQSRTTSR